MEKINNSNSVYLLKLTASVINETDPPEPDSSIDFSEVYKLAKLHSILNLTYYAVERLHNKPDSELLKKWKNKRNQCIHRNMIQTQEFNIISKKFEENKIEFMPVKGFFLSNLYPKPDYRFMSDLDFLVKKEHLKLADSVLISMGYKAKKIGVMYDDEFEKPPFMYIELHHELFAMHSPFYTYFENAFERSIQKNKFRFEMKGEEAYIYFIAHLYKHYYQAGTGVRSISDLYLLNKERLPELDKKYISTNLEKLGLSDFTKKVSDIAEKWFGANADYNFSEDELYIISSGTYGTAEKKYLHKYSSLGSKHYYLKRIFPPLIVMKDIFHPLRRFPFLLPLFYMIRIFSLILPSKRKKIRAEIVILNKTKNKKGEKNG